MPMTREALLATADLLEDVPVLSPSKFHLTVTELVGSHGSGFLNRLPIDERTYLVELAGSAGMTTCYCLVGALLTHRDVMLSGFTDKEGADAKLLWSCCDLGLIKTPKLREYFNTDVIPAVGKIYTYSDSVLAPMGKAGVRKAQEIYRKAADKLDHQ